MTRADFIELVNYTSEAWRGYLTPAEKKQAVEDFLTEYHIFKEKSHLIYCLINQLLEDVLNGSEESMAWLVKLTS